MRRLYTVRVWAVHACITMNGPLKVTHGAQTSQLPQMSTRSPRASLPLATASSLSPMRSIATE